MIDKPFIVHREYARTRLYSSMRGAFRCAAADIFFEKVCCPSHSSWSMDSNGIALLSPMIAVVFTTSM